ncbi:MAG TPA: choice-of-anchor R domain-containing protein, partial [Moheibacter sp.]|nr:choice-of-anchor R domain-containing protein [Moheibacter sp.]
MKNILFQSRWLLLAASAFLMMSSPLKAVPWLLSDSNSEMNTQTGVSSLQKNNSQQVNAWDTFKVFDYLFQADFAFFVPQTITQNVSQAIVPGTIACGSAVGGYNSENIYYRIFDLAANHGISEDFEITDVEFGVESTNKSLPVTVNIYSTSASFPAGFPGSATLQGTATHTVVVGDAGKIVSLPLTATIPAGEKMIYELISDGKDSVTKLYLGSNNLGETGVSYILAGECGITTPTPLAGIGYPDVHVIMNVIGEEVTNDGGATGDACFDEGFDGLSGGNTSGSGSNGPTTAEWTGNANFPTTVKAFEAGDAVKLGTGSQPGSIESKVLDDVSGDITVNIMVKGWTNIEGSLVVEIDGQTQTATYAAKMTDDFEEVSVNFTGVTAGSKLKIATSAKRAFIDSVEIICEEDGGTDPEPGADCEQGIPSFSVVPDGRNINSTNAFRVAEDFTVEAGVTFTLNQITIDVNQVQVPNNAVIRIHSDNSGVPGAVIETITMAPSSSEVVGSAFGDPIHHLVFDLATPIELEEGTYWLDPKMSTPTPETVWWAATDVATHGALPQLSGDNGVTWEVEEDEMNMIFTVSGTCIVDGGSSGSGETCEDALLVTSLPYDHAGNTGDYGNDYSFSDVPPVAPGAVTTGTGSVYYLDGADVVYAYTPT